MSSSATPSSGPELLGSPFTLPNGQVIKNRLFKSAMSEALGNRRAEATTALPTLYGRWAKGGIGLSVTGNVMIDRRALGEPGNVVLEDERDLELLKQWAAAGQSAGGKIYMQLNHPGRQAPSFLNRETVAPSAVAFAPHMARFFATARALEGHEIEGIIARFATAAAIAEKAGFDGIQIHGAHGYLVSQFLSPKTNLRSDEWGGTAEKRRRFVVEVYRAIRAATSEGFGVSIKINSADFQKGGITEVDSAETIVALASEGMDFVEISGGTYEAPAMMGARASTLAREAYFLEFAQALRAKMDSPLVVTGGFRSGAAMADAVSSGATDMVGIARSTAIDPDFPNRLMADPEACIEITPRRTGIKAIDKLGMVELTWYTRQLQRMGGGKEPRPNENALYSALAHFAKTGVRGFRQQRTKE